MTIAKSLLQEFEAQAPVTRKFLERLSPDKLTWKPHAKSMSAGQLALHIAQVPGGVLRLAEPNPAQVPNFAAAEADSIQQILDAHDESLSIVRQLLPTFSDDQMHETWRLEVNGHEILALPRYQFLRDVMLNHWYQHRGQFGVYLRLLDIPVPSSYGPSADEQPAFMQQATAGK
ncbi:MAG TPA: DinB family protein [Bryobacteraceae bacterium]|nr:DinB family protein [Bryobacteraceae bacterium]